MGKAERQYETRPGKSQILAAGGNFAEWSVPWSDLMMIMFVVFAVLFIYTSTHKDQTTPPPGPRPASEAAATRAPSDPMQAFLGQLDAPVRDAKTLQNVNGAPLREIYYQSDNLGISVVRETDRQVRVFLRGDLFFAPGGADLASNSAPYLARIAEILRVSSGAVLVIGHTAEGETKTEADGLGLSARRAASVAEYFIRTAKLDAKRFLVTGRGSFKPEVPASDADAARRNRRVEVLVLTDM